ncbi:DUF7560 family zinc ribbon protein [Halobiforma nitratireducens]|uniref:DUF7560 family zinc ribbon protein n=1 Tax=Halobiforma nitratireducens TaxID=130048 RepID=UPI0014615FF8|nr:hypothetical protein [Halobiforma nitratireducens]
MTEPGVPLYEFACPACGERTTVDDEVLEALLASGCVFCESPVSRSDFERVHSTRS